MDTPIPFRITDEEYAQVFESGNADRLGSRILSGVVLPDMERIVLIRDDYRPIVISFAQFAPGYRGPSGKTFVGLNLAPDFTKPAIRDHGATVAFGEFEACVDAIVMEAK